MNVLLLSSYPGVESNLELRQMLSKLRQDKIASLGAQGTSWRAISDTQGWTHLSNIRSDNTSLTGETRLSKAQSSELVSHLAPK